ncbi:MAG TPA: hypothetical protein VFP61_10510 [Acidimicrobiales bacterium]|nr:hypothetical protein [Acidimicrobiales bacterium]
MTRNLRLMFGGAFVVVLVAFYLAVWSPSVTSMKKAQADLAAAQGNVATTALQHAMARNQLRLLPEQEQLAAELQQAAPADPGIPDLIDQLNTVAAASGVTISNESWSVPGAGGAAGATSSAATPAPGAIAGLTPIPVTIALTGPQANVLVFVHNLSAVPRLIKVGSLTLAQSSGAGGATASGTTSIAATVYEATSKLPTPPKGH